jgi:hypothetical protein
MTKATILTEKQGNLDYKSIKTVNVYGPCQTKLKDQLTQRGWAQDSVDSIFEVANNAVEKFVDPNQKNQKLVKMLCLGKVQSGKTTFFISTIATAFDNGYNLAYVIGGTKNNLLKQNIERIAEEFSNNDNVKVDYVVSAEHDHESTIKLLSRGYKVILLVLKNKSGETNLSALRRLVSKLSDFPSLIVDDEGDEHTPGNVKTGKGAVHDEIINILSEIHIGTYLCITATPQANLLLPTIDGISPDCVVLVPPGTGYTGASTFHDVLENGYTTRIIDSDDFSQKVPKTFREALLTFIVSCGIWRRRNDKPEPLSMLIHPSAYTVVHDSVFRKIQLELETIKSAYQDKNHLKHDLLISEMKSVFDVIKQRIIEKDLEFVDIQKIIDSNLDKTQIYTINRVELPSTDDEQKMYNDQKWNIYRIFIGGAMLERGITIENLAVTYIFRDSKGKIAADTLFQRARWLGYKKKYLDLCRVYLKDNIADYFVTLTDMEDHLWNTLDAFNKSGLSLKMMRRRFKLNDKRLLLTRRSISKTLFESYVTTGYTYEKSITYTNRNDVLRNIELLRTFLSEIKPFGSYSYGEKHKHILYKTSITKFYEKIISKYTFPSGSQINQGSFGALVESVKFGRLDDNVTFVLMREGETTIRKHYLNSRILELPQGSNSVQGEPNYYPGDRYFIKDEVSIQVHFVNVAEPPTEDNLFPFLAICNPFDFDIVNYATGEHD